MHKKLSFGMWRARIELHMNMQHAITPEKNTSVNNHLTAVFSALLFLLLLSPVFTVAQEKPDAPVAKTSQLDEQLKKKYPDLFHMDKPVNGWREAARQPAMLAFESAYVGSTVVDIEGTQHCIAIKSCRESNPLLGQSRAQAYAVTGAANVAVIFAAAKLRQHQHGNAAVAILWAGTIVHLWFGISGLREHRVR